MGGEANNFLESGTVKLLATFKSTRACSKLIQALRAARYAPVLKEIFLAIQPAATWNRLTADARRPGFVLIFYVVPMMLLLMLVEGHGLMVRGRAEAGQGMTNRFTGEKVFVLETCEMLLTLVLIFLAACFITQFANACHRRNRLSQALVVMLHSIGPLLLVQLFNGFPYIYPWLTWLAGMGLVIGALYNGLPRIMLPDPPSAMGLFLGSSVIVFLVLFAGRFFSYWYLIGEFRPLEKWLEGIAAQLPF